MATPANDTRSLVEIAIDAHTDLAKLATGLAHAGADPHAVAGIQRIGDMVGEIAKGLGNAQHVGGQPGQPGAQEPAPAPGPGGEAAGGPAPAAPAGPPQGAMPGERPNGLHEAAANMQAQLAANHAAAQKALSRNQ